MQDVMEVCVCVCVCTPFATLRQPLAFECDIACWPNNALRHVPLLQLKYQLYAARRPDLHSIQCSFA